MSLLVATCEYTWHRNDRSWLLRVVVLTYPFAHLLYPVATLTVNISILREPFLRHLSFVQVTETRSQSQLRLTQRLLVQRRKEMEIVMMKMNTWREIKLNLRVREAAFQLRIPVLLASFPFPFSLSLGLSMFHSRPSSKQPWGSKSSARMLRLFSLKKHRCIILLIEYIPSLSFFRSRFLIPAFLVHEESVWIDSAERIVPYSVSILKSAVS